MLKIVVSRWRNLRRHQEPGFHLATEAEIKQYHDLIKTYIAENDLKMFEIVFEDPAWCVGDSKIQKNGAPVFWTKEASQNYASYPSAALGTRLEFRCIKYDVVERRQVEHNGKTYVLENSDWSKEDIDEFDGIFAVYVK